MGLDIIQLQNTSTFFNFDTHKMCFNHQLGHRYSTVILFCKIRWQSFTLELYGSHLLGWYALHIAMQPGVPYCDVLEVNVIYICVRKKCTLMPGWDWEHATPPSQFKQARPPPWQPISERPADGGQIQRTEQLLLRRPHAILIFFSSYLSLLQLRNVSV